MKKALLFLMAIPVIILAVEVQDPGGYMAAKWGMTKDEVKAAFPDKFSHRKSIYTGWYNSISYFDQLAGQKYETLFSFNKENKLEAVCLFPEPNMSIGKFDYFSPMIRDFPTLLSNLTAKYGDPNNITAVDKSIFVNDTIGLKNGTAKIEYQWKLETTVIYLRIERDMREPRGVLRMDAMMNPPILHYRPLLEYRDRKTVELPSPTQNIQDKI